MFVGETGKDDAAVGDPTNAVNGTDGYSVGAVLYISAMPLCVGIAPGTTEAAQAVKSQARPRKCRYLPITMAGPSGRRCSRFV